MVPASSYSQFPNKTKTFENACVIMLKCAINSKIQNKMPPWLMAKQGLLWHKSNVSVLLALYLIELLNVYILYLIHIYIYIYIYIYIFIYMYMYISVIRIFDAGIWCTCILLMLPHLIRQLAVVFFWCEILRVVFHWKNLFLTPCMQVK